MAYSKTSATKHPGVSIVERRGAFWLKWRNNAEPGVYRYSWERLSEDVDSREQAEEIAKVRSLQLAPLRDVQRRERGSGRGSRTICRALDSYVYQFTEGLGDGAKTQLERQLQRFKGAFGELICDALTLGALASWRVSMARAGLSPASVNRYMDQAKAALNWMASQGYVHFTTRELRHTLRHYPTQARTRGQHRQQDPEDASGENRSRTEG